MGIDSVAITDILEWPLVMYNLVVAAVTSSPVKYSNLALVAGALGAGYYYGGVPSLDNGMQELVIQYGVVGGVIAMGKAI